MADSYRLLKTYEFLHKAELDFAKLKSEEVMAYMADSNTVNIAPYYAQAVGGIKLYVSEDDFERAWELLSNDRTEEESLKEVFADDSLEPAARCPRCQSPNVFREHSLLSGLFFLFATFLPISVPKNKLHCAKCDHTWKAEK